MGGGDYSIQIEDNTGKRVEEITYGLDRVEKLVSLVKLADEGKVFDFCKNKIDR
ncbi:MAG: hypothetical protein U5K54_23695 [Cytophagales bacterium]|nr:hypothetical protein [Cytophagales bacterium]